MTLKTFLAYSASLGLLSTAAGTACSSKTETTVSPDAGAAADGAAAACDPAKCPQGQKCIAHEGAVACRKECTSQADCSLNATCKDPGNGALYCAPNKVQLKVSELGLWGAFCNPADGIENPSCDSEQGFQCYADSPGDGEAICTRFDCKDDTDCGGGMYCATVNKQPNAEDGTRPFPSEAQKVCLKRVYCAPCASNLDCADGLNETCATSAKGGNFCTRACSADANCPLDAACVEGTCQPRAGTCKGDGGMCSPCRADTDCKAGSCVKAESSPERFCTERIPGKSCRDKGVCPPAPEGGQGAGCFPADSKVKDYPVLECLGLVKLGSDTSKTPPEPIALPGCWSRAR
jgi:hypothetical protein